MTGSHCSTHGRRWLFAGLIVALTGVVVPPTAPAQGLDRTKRPVAPPQPLYAFPVVHEQTLSNGLTVRVVEDHALPLVAVRATIAGDSLLDPVGKEGLYVVHLGALRDGTTSMSGDQLAQAIDELGAPIAPTAFTTVTAELDQALALMGDMLMHPTFAAGAVERRKAALVTRLQQDEGFAITPARRIFNVELWGPSHPFARHATPATVAGITRDDVARFHDEHVRPQTVTLTLVGDVSSAAAMASVKKVFGEWHQGAGQRAAVTVPPAPPAKSTTIYLYDRPGAPQSIVMVGQAGPPRSGPDFYALEALGQLLGGPTGSRLSLALRERRALTYGVTHFPTWRRAADPSSFFGTASVEAAKTDTALQVWLGELKDIVGPRPPVERELPFARSATIGGLATRISTLDTIAARLRDVARDGLPPTYYDQYVHGMSRVTIAEVVSAASRYIDPAHLTIVVVGDRKVIEPALRAANIAPIVVVDENGKAIP